MVSSNQCCPICVRGRGCRPGDRCHAAPVTMMSIPSGVRAAEVSGGTVVVIAVSKTRHDGEQHIEVDWLPEEDRAPRGANRLGGQGVSADYEDRELGEHRAATERLEHVRPRHLGEAPIEDDERATWVV